MDFNRQVEELVKYIKSGEKDCKNTRIGIELEHFVIDNETLRTVSYYGENGVASVLKDLEEKGWKGSYEGQYILGVSKGDKVISLEPGSQLELSINAKDKISELEEEYLDFLGEIIPVLNARGYSLIATAYHSETKIEEIKLLPKKRYDYMFDYFKTRGKNAHNMMKGTASLQMSIDYSSEEDYRKKFRVANALAPVLHALFDNGYYFEGKPWGKYNLRTQIWNNCDSHRCGTVEGALDDDFGYGRYAEYILNRPAILLIKNGETIFTGGQKIKEFFDPENYDLGEVDHLLTMFFPDARTKKYIEIRMIDAIPYPLNFAAISLLKGLFYNQESLDSLYDYIKDISLDDVAKAKESIIENGLRGTLKGQNMVDFGKYLVGLAKKGLSQDEIHYIEPLEEMLAKGINPYEVTKSRAGLGKKESLEWSILNKIVEGK